MTEPKFSGSFDKLREVIKTIYTFEDGFRSSDGFVNSTGSQISSFSKIQKKTDFKTEMVFGQIDEYSEQKRRNAISKTEIGQSRSANKLLAADVKEVRHSK